MTDAASRSIRWAQAGLLVNVLLVLVKLIAGIVGHANALVADAIESSADIFSSLIVWMGLSIAARPADEDHPHGHGKAEPLAAAVVSLMLLGAAVGISIMAIREIVTPHHLPAPFTLFVAAGVIVIKEVLYRRVSKVGTEVGARRSSPTRGTIARTPPARSRRSSESASHCCGVPAGKRLTTGPRSSRH